MLDLHYIAKIAISLCHDPLVPVCPLRKLRADPIEPTADRLPSFFDSASKSSRESDIISMGPEGLEGRAPPVLEFELCGVNFRHHCLKLLTGGGFLFVGLLRVNFVASDQP